jgi:hypothetical protein
MSQGGALTFLLTPYLYSLQTQGKLPSDIRFKNYSTAAPKVGNLYYAYDYAEMMQFGWALTIPTHYLCIIFMTHIII